MNVYKEGRKKGGGTRERDRERQEGNKQNSKRRKGEEGEQVGSKIGVLSTKQ